MTRASRSSNRAAAYLVAQVRLVGASDVDVSGIPDANDDGVSRLTVVTQLIVSRHPGLALRNTEVECTFNEGGQTFVGSAFDDTTEKSFG